MKKKLDNQMDKHHMALIIRRHIVEEIYTWLNDKRREGDLDIAEEDIEQMMVDHFQHTEQYVNNMLNDYLDESRFDEQDLADLMNDNLPLDAYREYINYDAILSQDKPDGLFFTCPSLLRLNPKNPPPSKEDCFKHFEEVLISRHYPCHIIVLLKALHNEIHNYDTPENIPPGKKRKLLDLIFEFCELIHDIEITEREIFDHIDGGDKYKNAALLDIPDDFFMRIIRTKNQMIIDNLPDDIRSTLQNDYNKLLDEGEKFLINWRDFRHNLQKLLPSYN